MRASRSSSPHCAAWRSSDEHVATAAELVAPPGVEPVREALRAPHLVGDRAADEVHPPGAGALLLQRGGLVLRGDEQRIGHRVEQDPVDLRRLAPVACAQARVDPRDGDAELGRRERGAERRVGGPCHHDDSRPQLLEDLLRRRERRGDLDGMGGRRHAERAVGRREPEALAEPGVVLSRVEERHAEDGGARQRRVDGSERCRVRIAGHHEHRDRADVVVATRPPFQHDKRWTHAQTLPARRPAADWTNG